MKLLHDFIYGMDFELRFIVCVILAWGVWIPILALSWNNPSLTNSIALPIAFPFSFGILVFGIVRGIYETKTQEGSP